MLVLSLPAESGPHENIKHEVLRQHWAKEFRGREQVLLDTFADSLFDAIEGGHVPDAAPALDEGGCKVRPCWHI
jgi:hypothetical protein